MDHEISWSHHPAFGSCHLFTWIDSKNMGSMWCWTWIFFRFHARFLGKKSNMDLFAGHGWSPYQDHVKTHGWCGRKLQKLGCPAPCPLKRLSWPVWPTVEPSVFPRVEHGNSTFFSMKFLWPMICIDMSWRFFFTSWISWFLRRKAILWAAELDNKTQRPATTRASDLPHVMRQKPLWCSWPRVEFLMIFHWKTQTPVKQGLWWFLTGKFSQFLMILKFLKWSLMIFNRFSSAFWQILAEVLRLKSEHQLKNGEEFLDSRPIGRVYLWII